MLTTLQAALSIVTLRFVGALEALILQGATDGGLPLSARIIVSSYRLTLLVPLAGVVVSALIWRSKGVSSRRTLLLGILLVLLLSQLVFLQISARVLYPIVIELSNELGADP
ncbi:MAG TPA: hypothetical protein VJQ57_08875 [Acidimicrobiia bacterium]|nr:hypothetical protein [Acidimicrobiia bacterium]